MAINKIQNFYCLVESKQEILNIIDIGLLNWHHPSDFYLLKKVLLLYKIWKFEPDLLIKYLLIKKNECIEYH